MSNENVEFCQVEIHTVIVKKRMSTESAEFEGISSEQFMDYIDQATTGDPSVDSKCEDIINNSSILEESEPMYYSESKGTTEYSYSMSAFEDPETHEFMGGSVVI
tara:strand:+ start:2315 stop:2629 length:315 start_codon:yes stop_codon:yes gene_type:complete